MNSPARDDPPMMRLIDFWEKLTPHTVQRLVRVYATDATFKDPFNDVAGIDAIRRILEKMFESLDDVHFQIVDAIRSDATGFLVWNLTFRMRGNPQVHIIEGSTHVRFDAEGRVAHHRDYWDTGEGVYEKIPVVGTVLRAVKKRIG